MESFLQNYKCNHYMLRVIKPWAWVTSYPWQQKPSATFLCKAPIFFSFCPSNISFMELDEH